MTVQVGDRIALSVIGDAKAADEIVQAYQFRMVSGSPLTDDAAMGDLVEVLEALWVIISQLHAISVVFRRMKGQDVGTGRLLPEQAFSPVLTGVVAEADVPQQVMFPLSFLTTTPHVILRKMYGPTAEANLTASGRYTPAAISVATSASVMLLAPILATLATWEYGYESPKTLGWVVPVSATFSITPGTLRKRREGRGS